MGAKPKIVVACDSFKGSLTSTEAGRAVADGIHDIYPDAETIVIPIADGGEGMMNAVISGTEGTAIECMVHDPLKRPIRAYYGICGDTAVVEMAQASGLTLLRDAERDPLTATTYGTGELIADALKRGCRSFLVGIGGSATNDGGIGMLKALGYRFLDGSGNLISDTVADLNKIAGIDDSNLVDGLRESSFTVACDVRNPLTGADGASSVFGPQKGGTPEMITKLDHALTSFADVTAKFIGTDYSATPGSGAGGGIGFAFLAYLNGKLKPGIEMVLD
ncbi:MAG: glycerate kinase, partial [Muribaculaceae bacterium]|nr:glycerate kinase [Muribaculaceae bacterium]